MTVTGWLSKVFGLNPAGLNWPRSVLILDLMLVPLVLFWAIGYEQYLLSALFGEGTSRAWPTREVPSGNACRASPRSR